MDYLSHIAIMIAIYTVLAVSLDLLVGHTGLLSVAQAAFFGLGAYTSALLAIHFDVSFFIGILVSITMATLLSFSLSLPSLRLHDDYFVIATFCFQMIFYSIFNNWINLTSGPLGLAGIPRPSILGWQIRSQTDFLLLSWVLAGLAYFVVGLITTSPFGRVLRAIREDEVFVQSLGKNALRFKVTSFAISASLAAAAGGVYAHYITYIDPTNFTITESTQVCRSRVR